MSCPRIKLSNSQTLFLDSVATGFFLLDFAQQRRHKNGDAPDIYFTLLDATGISPTLILNQNAKAKVRGSWSLSQSEYQKLQRLYTQGCYAHGSLRKFVKSSNLSVTKVRQFLHSKPPYKKFNLATRKIKRMKTFAKFKNDFWCMDLACVGKLA